ncbi:ATPase H(+)-transporting accessory protein 2 [Spodoptera frugiperda]|uniref:ATPase H(+)-transporting accessory protein 2 n=1 Tax=Spodoptera frugiperda TaxID=7108 RepID=A0A9R0D611_SPOFR|nr:ATPase H(+)-transporting accessory protein 2 [Spodoptera frugiperda]
MTVSRLFPNKMAVTMALFWVSLVLSIIGSNASGEFNILHSPDSLKFTGSGKTSESLLKEIFSAALGLSVEENSEWKGMYVVDPFNTPEAVVEIYIDGVSSLGHAGLKTKTYPLIVDEYEPDTFQGVKHRIKQRFTNGGNKIVNIRLTDVDELKKNVFGDAKKSKPAKLSLMHLKYNVEEDYHFLNELASLQAITTKIEDGGIVPDNMIDFFNLRFRTLHPLSDFHGPNSVHTKEAKKLLGEAIEQLNKAFIKAYDGSVLVTLVTTDVAHTRRAIRSAPAAGPDGKPAEYEWQTKEFKAENDTDDSYSSEYPAIFNIILWFAVVIIFSLIAIVYALMDMDPGRDSIIYRMTSTRMKKDN